MSVHSAGAYTATLQVMANVMRGGGRVPPHPHQPGLILPSMTECTPESRGCYTVYSVGSTELVQHFAYRGTSAQGAATARHIINMVWLYRQLFVSSPHFPVCER